MADRTIDGWIGLDSKGKPCYDTIHDNEGEVQELRVFKTQREAEDRYRRVAAITMEYEEVRLTRGGRIG